MYTTHTCDSESRPTFVVAVSTTDVIEGSARGSEAPASFDRSVGVNENATNSAPNRTSSLCTSERNSSVKRYTTFCTVEPQIATDYITIKRV